MRRRKLNIKLLAWLLLALAIVTGSVYFLHGYQIDRNAGNLLHLAQEAEEKGELREAAKLYRQYVNFRPEDYAGYIKMADALIELTESPDANRDDLLVAYSSVENAVRTIDPQRDEEAAESHRQARKLGAEFSMSIRRFGDAKDHLEYLLKDNPDDPELNLQYAKALIGLKLYTPAASSGRSDQPSALEVLQDMVGFNPTTEQFNVDNAVAPKQIEAYVLLAQLERQIRNDREMADAVLDQMVKANPGNFKANLERGRALWRHDPAKAKEYIAKAREQAPEGEDAEVLLRSAEFAREEDVEKATAILEKAIEAYPDDDRFYRVLANIARADERLSDARAIIDRGLQAVPDHRELLTQKAELEILAGDLDAARATMEKMEAVHVQSYRLDYLQARIWQQEGNWVEAARTLEEIRPTAAALGSRPTMQVDLLLGESYEQLGQLDRAVDAYERAMMANPASKLAKAGFDRAQARLQGSQTAQTQTDVLSDEKLKQLPFEEHLAEVLKQRRDAEPHAKKMLRAELYAQRDQYERAEREMREARQTFADRPSVWMASIQLALRNPQASVQDALKMFDEARKQFADNPRFRLTRENVWGMAIDVAARNPDTSREEIAQLVEDARKDLGDSYVVRAAEITLASRRDVEDREERRRSLKSLEEGLDEFDDRQQAALWEALGRVYKRAGFPDDSKRCMGQVARLLPNNLRAKTSLFQLALEAGDDETMAEIIKDVQRMNEDTVWRYLQAARLVYQVQTGQKDDPSLLDDAQTLLDEAKKSRPDWHDLYRVQGQAEMLRGNYEAAADSFSRCLELGPPEPMVVRSLHAILSRLGRRGEAQRLLARLGQEQRANISPQQQAENLMVLGNTQQALQLAEQVVAQDAENPSRHLWHAQLLARAEKNEEAEQALRKAVELEPRRSLTWLNLIRHLISTGNKEEAEAELRRASLSVVEDEVPQLRAQGFEMLGDLAQAERHYHNLLQWRPDDPATLRSLASFYINHFGNRRIGLAMRYLNRILSGKEDLPGNADRHVAWARRVVAQIMASGNHQQVNNALDLLDKNAVDGELPLADKRTAAMFLSRRPEPDFQRQAIQMFESLQAEKKLGTDQQFRLAMLYWSIGDWPKCRTLMNDLMARADENLGIPAQFCRMYLDRNELRSAETIVRRMEQLAPDNPNTLRTKAQLLAKQGKMKEAANALTELLPTPLTPKDAQVVQQVGMLCTQLQMYEQAEKVFRKLAELSPEGGTLLLAQYLARHGDINEGFQMLEANLTDQLLPRVLQAAVNAVRYRPREEGKPFDATIEAWFQRARRQNPRSVSMAFQLALFREAQERYDDMEQIYYDLLKRDNLRPPQRMAVLNNLAFELALRGKQLDQALQMIDKAIALAGPRPELLDTRAMVKSGLGDHAGAIADIEQTLSAGPSPMQLFNLSCIQLAKGDLEEARASLVRSQELGLSERAMNSLQRKKYKDMMLQLNIQQARRAA